MFTKSKPGRPKRKGSKRSETRVELAQCWTQKHWVSSENPGQPVHMCEGLLLGLKPYV